MLDIMRNIKKLENSISKSMGRAIAENSLIENNDRILVGVSGGKDSLTLLKILAKRRKWVPIKYDIVACHIFSNEVGLECHDRDSLKKFFTDMGCEYVFEDSEMLGEKGNFSCFWCSWNRRKAIFTLADKYKCKKVALAHNMDDAAETMLMNLFFHGEISGLNAKQDLFGGKLAIVRPMIYLEERKIAEYAKAAGLPVSRCSCPNAKNSNRQKMKDMIGKLEKEFGYVKKNIMNAPHRIREEYLGVKYG